MFTQIKKGSKKRNNQKKQQQNPTADSDSPTTPPLEKEESKVCAVAAFSINSDTAPVPQPDCNLYKSCLDSSATSSSPDAKVQATTENFSLEKVQEIIQDYVGMMLEEVLDKPIGVHASLL